MAEPHSSAVVTATAIGGATLAGTLFGLHYDALGFGCAASLFSLLHIPTEDGAPRSTVRTFMMVASATFFAATLAPVAALASVEYIPWTSKLGVDMLRITAAALIGVGIHVAMPVALSWVKRAGSKL